jgi:acylphosphatase
MEKTRVIVKGKVQKAGFIGGTVEQANLMEIKRGGGYEI